MDAYPERDRPGRTARKSRPWDGPVFRVFGSEDFGRSPKGAVPVARTTNPARTECTAISFGDSRCPVRNRKLITVIRAWEALTVLIVYTLAGLLIVAP